MTTPTHGMPAAGSSPPMSADRWRAVDAILQAALACEPARRDAVVAAACGDDEALRLEVVSLLAAHADAGDDFLERPAAESLAAGEPPLAPRLAHALAGRYRIDREVGRGGMAIVYLAHDLRHDRAVAIKVLRPEVAAAVGAERFLAEIRVTASLQHPHILPLFDSGTADGLPWYAMPFVDGETLRARLARVGALPVADAVRIAREIAEALDHAHVHGIVHRDVKPENVLLQNGHALVADFGIALALQQAGGERLTRTGLALGTPQYMSPEQASGARTVDERADVYGLGAVLHEMLAGEPPFAGPNRQVVVQRLMHERPPALATYRPDVAPFVASAVQRALARQPADRFPSAAAFAAALAAPLPAPDAIQHAGSDDVPRRAPGRTIPARLALYAAAATFLFGFGSGLFTADSPLVKGLTGRVRAAAPAAGSRNVDGRTAAQAMASDAPIAVVDRTGHLLRGIAAQRPWTPRFSPDGQRVAYGAYGAGRETSDLWVTELATGATRRLTDGDDDANDPQWSRDGVSLAYSANAPGGKDVMVRPAAEAAAKVVVARNGIQFPSDWLPGGKSLLVTEEAAHGKYDILVQPADGSRARRYISTPASENAARISPDGHWVAYTSDASGRLEVYVDAYPNPGRRVKLSSNGGLHPVWRGDGRELYYWRGDVLVAVQLEPAAGGDPPTRGAETELFHAPYPGGVSTMYDVSKDGQRFVIARGS